MHAEASETRKPGWQAGWSKALNLLSPRHLTSITTIHDLRCATPHESLASLMACRKRPNTLLRDCWISASL